MKKTLVLALVTIFVMTSAAIAQCSNPNQIVKNHRREGFKVTSQSKAGALISGKEYEMCFVAQANMEYLLSFGTNYKEVDPNIHFVIYEKVVHKVVENGKKVYKKIENVLYDSNSEEGIKEANFVNRKTRKLYLRIDVPVKENQQEAHCIGILIENKRALKLGLN